MPGRMEEDIVTTQQTTLDIDALRRGIESSDAALLLSLYADDAELRVIDRVRQPSKPLDLRGKAAIAAYLEDICGRAMTHCVEQVVAGDGQVAFTEACSYPDGTRVFCASMLDTRDGKIVHQVNVQAWDE